MRFRLEKLPTRFPSGILPVIALYGTLLFYLGVHFWLESEYQFCWFKRATGVSCPGCGLSRSYLSLLRGDPLAALVFNPFMLVFTLFILLQQSSTIIFKRRLKLEATPAQMRAILIALGVLLALNWIYLMLMEHWL